MSIRDSAGNLFLSQAARRRERTHTLLAMTDEELRSEVIKADKRAVRAAPLIEAAVDDELGEWPDSLLPAFAFLDLSRKRDLTSRVVVVRLPARRPEAHDHLTVATVRT